MKLIINCDPEDYNLAIRAAMWMIGQPATQKDAVVSYGRYFLGQTDDKAYFYVKRNKASISVRENK